MKKTYLIIGSSASSSAVINTLANLNAGEIVCVTKDSVSYNTCFISDYLANKKQEIDIILPIKKESNNKLINFYNKTVDKIEPFEKKVILDDKQEIYYDKLFLGVGSEPINSFDNSKQIPGIFTFHNFNDASSIKKYISENNVKTAIVIGGGLTGLECAYALNLLSIPVTIIEQKGYILSNIINAQDSYWLIDKINKKIKIITSIFVTKYYKIGKKIGICLSNGIEFFCDIVIIAQGCAPSLKLAENANISCEEGIITNKFLQTNNEDIYAGGDCSMVNSLFGDSLIKNTMWPDAIIQGVIAAYNMSGIEKRYPGLLKKINSYFFDLKFFKCGEINQNHVRQETQDFYGIIAFDKDKIITGALLMGNFSMQNESLLRTAIFQQKKIDNIDIKGYK